MAVWKPGAVRTVICFQERLRRPCHYHLTVWSSREWKTHLTRLRSGRKESGGSGKSPRKHGMMRASFAGNHDKLSSPNLSLYGLYVFELTTWFVCLWIDLGLPGKVGTMSIEENRVWVGRIRQGKREEGAKILWYFSFSLCPRIPGDSWRQSCWKWANCWRPPQGWIGDPAGSSLVYCGQSWEDGLCSNLGGCSRTMSSRPGLSLQIRRHDTCVELCTPMISALNSHVRYVS